MPSSPSMVIPVGPGRPGKPELPGSPGGPGNPVPPLTPELPVHIKKMNGVILSSRFLAKSGSQTLAETIKVFLETDMSVLLS